MKSSQPEHGKHGFALLPNSLYLAKKLLDYILEASHKVCPLFGTFLFLRLTIKVQLSKY